MRKVAAAGVAAVALVVAAYVVILDQWAGVTNSVAFDLVIVLIMSGLGVAAFVLTRSRLWILIPASAVALIAFVRMVDVSPVKPALRAVESIRPGMTEMQVRAILDRAFPPAGSFKRPDIGPLRSDTLSFALDLNDGRYNAAVVEIRFVNGRCTSARFLAD